jgi:hypothetical protein
MIIGAKNNNDPSHVVRWIGRTEGVVDKTMSKSILTPFDSSQAVVPNGRAIFGTERVHPDAKRNWTSN